MPKTASVELFRRYAHRFHPKYLVRAEKECRTVTLSGHAKDSSWVKREVQYALARQGVDEAKPPEIRPVILERIAPWGELSHLHFDDRVLYFMRRV